MGKLLPRDEHSTPVYGGVGLPSQSPPLRGACPPTWRCPQSPRALVRWYMSGSQGAAQRGGPDAAEGPEPAADASETSKTKWKAAQPTAGSPGGSFVVRTSPAMNPRCVISKDAMTSS